MASTKRHKVFVSFHEQDRKFCKLFANQMGSALVDRSVQEGDIDPKLKVATTRAKIRDEFIADASVTVVLVGTCTWRRRHVDWEIGSSLTDTEENPRCGLIGILLPTHPDYRSSRCHPSLIPPRFADNLEDQNYFARIYHWPSPWNPQKVHGWIHAAFKRRDKVNPKNSRHPFGKNWRGPCASGWQTNASSKHVLE